MKSAKVAIWAACVIVAGTFTVQYSRPQEGAPGCGPQEEMYQVIKHKESPMRRPSPGRGLVFVLRAGVPKGFTLGAPLALAWARRPLRVGVNGKWVGVTEPSTYFFFEASPGLSMLCDEVNRIPFFLTVEEGKTYYIGVGRLGGTRPLAPVTEEEARKMLPKLHYVTMGPKQ